jgi:hypothetical protein
LVAQEGAALFRAEGGPKLFAKINAAQNDAGGFALELPREELRGAHCSIRSRNRRNCSSRWSGAIRETCSISSIAEALTAHGISLAPSSIEHSTTIRLNS